MPPAACFAVRVTNRRAGSSNLARGSAICFKELVQTGICSRLALHALQSSLALTPHGSIIGNADANCRSGTGRADYASGRHGICVSTTGKARLREEGCPCRSWGSRIVWYRQGRSKERRGQGQEARPCEGSPSSWQDHSKGDQWRDGRSCPNRHVARGRHTARVGVIDAPPRRSYAR